MTVLAPDRPETTAGAPSTIGPMAERRYRMLGGLEVLDGTERIELGTRKQRAVLAALLLEEARVVSVDRLVEALWEDDPPNRAEASLQSYISTLRRALEPERGPRATPTLLVTDSGGYALLAQRDQVDLWRFADLVDEGRALHATGDLAGAATKLRNGLAMSASLLPEFAQDAFARNASLRFDALQSAALELSYEVRLALGEHQLLIADLEAAVHRYPLHEGLWALLAIARYRVGRQSEALRAIDECRRVLSEQTGVGLSPRLRQLESDLLEQAAHLDPPTGPVTASSTSSSTSSITAETLVSPTEDEDRTEGTTSIDLTVVDLPARAPADDHAHPTAPFVGRTNELHTVSQALDTIGRSGSRSSGSVLLVEGEPGSGKTRLLELTAERAVAHGAPVHWARCAEGAGTPALWPWIQVVSSLLRTLDMDERAELLATELGNLLTVRSAGSAAAALPAPNAQYALFDQVADLFTRIARAGDVVVIIDDLQWADPVSLELIDHLVPRLPAGILLVGARRDEAHHDAALTRTLATMARSADHRRIRLGPLATTEVAELVALETGHTLDPELAARLWARTEGNPFYVRELARSMDGADGDAESMRTTTSPDEAPGSVPAGVRDVVRGRMQGLDDATKELLLVAALIGRDVDLGLLARAATVDVERCLDDLEPAMALGVVVTPKDDPFSLRFSHDLVRESIIETAPPLRTPRLHLRIADALASQGADRGSTAERLAHHLWSAGPLADAARTGRALLVSARRALAKYAYESAQQRVELAIGLAESAGDEETELEALVLLTSIVGVRLGYVGAAAEQLDRAEQLARKLGHERQAADLLYSRWAAESQGIRLDRAAPLAAQLRAEGEASDDPIVRTHGYHAYGVDCWDRGRIGESLRALQQWEEDELVLESIEDATAEPLRYDLHLLSPVFLAQMYVLHGEIDRGWTLFDRIERTKVDGPYSLVVWGAFVTVASASIGDPERALTASRVCVEADPDLTFSFLGIYARIVHGWATAMTADIDDAGDGIAEMRRYIDIMRDQNARSGVHFMYALLGEALIHAGRVDEADEALVAASQAIVEHRQCYAEPLVLLVRAQLHHARGGTPAEVRTLIDRVRVMAVEREAFLYAQRADEFEATLE